MSNQDKFRPGAQVLAYHGPLVYEAKVLKLHEKGKMFVETGEGRSESLENNKIPPFLLDNDAYFLHYKGWSLKWDEWVSIERVMEFNDDNLGLSRELRNARKKAIEKMDPTREKKIEEEEKVPEKKRRKRESSEAPRTVLSQPSQHTESRNGPKKRPRSDGRLSYEVMVPFRPNLKCVLVDDWEYLTKDHKLVDLDTTTPVSKIVEQYLTYTRKNKSIPQEALLLTQEAMDGLLVFFDKLLSLDLLYRYERLQYSDVLTETPDMRPSEVYGLEHLLRLIVTLPAQIAQTSMDALSINVLIGQMKNLLEFLDDNLESLVSTYMNASPGYDRLSRGQ